MAFLKPSRLRKPQAARLMRWTLELMDSLAALVIFSAMALTMPQRWSRINRASTIQVRHATPFACGPCTIVPSSDVLPASPGVVSITAR
jgi:hypothetical protein